MTSGLGTKNNVSADSKGYTNMVTANLADAVVCSFDCLWVSEMILEKQINTLTRDKQSTETVPTCKCPVSIPPGDCERGGMVCVGECDWIHWNGEPSLHFSVERSWKCCLRVRSSCQDVDADVLVVSWLPLREHMLSLAPLRCLELASRVVLSRASHLLESTWCQCTPRSLAGCASHRQEAGSWWCGPFLRERQVLCVWDRAGGSLQKILWPVLLLIELGERP